MGAGKALTTWGKKGRFHYRGSVAEGTKVVYGHGSEFVVTAEQYAALLAHFDGRTVAIGASLNPARDSLGAWLRGKTGLHGLAAYVGPILVAEGLAERLGPMEIRFASSARRPA